MRQVGHTIIEEGIQSDMPFQDRRTVRGVIISKEGLVLMLYATSFDDYTFPGGGIKFHETSEQALKRELSEELGAEDIRIHRPIGYTVELRFGLNGSGQAYRQTSTYYHVDILKYGPPNLIGRENDHGLEARWIHPEDAIQHNRRIKNDMRHQQKGLRTVLEREEAVLSLIKENKS